MKKNPRDPKDPELQTRQRARGWGQNKRWRWVSRERMDELCVEHPRQLVRRVFFGRRVVVVQDKNCRIRAMVQRGRRGSLRPRAVAGLQLSVASSEFQP